MGELSRINADRKFDDHHENNLQNKGTIVKNLLILLSVVLLSGCVTMQGSYALWAVDAQGNELTAGQILIAEGRNIYPLRNALCLKHPGATVVIQDVKSGQPLKSESPYQCRNAKAR